MPHTWNVEDGQKSGLNRLDGNGQAMVSSAKKINPTTKYGYYRGVGWYQKNIDIPVNWKGKRVFVLFEAASQVAKVYINGQMLGEHRGAFTAFSYEITSLLQFGKENDLRVEVDNTHRMDLPPLSGDFNVNGGLYRKAWLIVTDKICISPLDYASSGVYITPYDISQNSAKIRIESILSNGYRRALSNEKEVLPSNVTLTANIIDTCGIVVASDKKIFSIPPDTTIHFIQEVSIDQPILWQGRTNPYLYKVRVRVTDNEKSYDSIEQFMGIRTFSIDNENGFKLNGKKYNVYGVGRHQDKKGKAWALGEDDDSLDMAIIQEMGATAIRLAHYPQCQSIHDLADKTGMLLWDEMVSWQLPEEGRV